jgi:hypothetical protein
MGTRERLGPKLRLNAIGTHVPESLNLPISDYAIRYWDETPVGSAMNRWALRMFISVLAVLMGVTASAESVAAKSRRDFNQSQARSKSKWSWQCYPYCDGGTYEGRPVREWMKPDRW